MNIAAISSGFLKWAWLIGVIRCKREIQAQQYIVPA